MFGTKNRGKESENAFKKTADASRVTADASIAKAAVEDPLLAARRARVGAIDNWERGVDAEGKPVPIDVTKMPGGGVNIGLFNDAMKQHDEGRVGGRGGSMAGGTNPNYVAELNKENELDKDVARKGAFEGYVNDTLAGNKAEMYGLGGAADARNMQVAGMNEGRYESDQDRYARINLMRLQQPNFFRQLAMNFAQGAGQGLGAGAGG